MEGNISASRPPLDLIGAITLSGLPQRDDRDLLTRTLADLLGVAAADIALAR